MSGTGIARLYYEAHITVEPYEQGSTLDDVMKYACKAFDMKVATFLMFHTDKPADGFVNLRAPTYDEIYSRLRSAVSYLEHAGHKIKRYKIEDTLFDSRAGDKF
jgi:hypothetical protein